jgi:tetratricopeptide (TPR) repeat protein
MKISKLWPIAASLLVTSCSHGATDSSTADSVPPGSFTKDPIAERNYELGTMASQRGEYKESINPLTEAIKHDHEFVAAYINRANSYNALKEYAKALDDANSALKYNSSSSYAFFQKAAAEEGLGQHVDAAEDYRHAAKSEPDESYKYLKLAEKCLEAGGQKKEAQALKNTLSTGKTAPLCVGRGLDNFSADKFSAAIKDYDQAIAADQLYASAYFNRGLAQAALGQYDKALSDYNKALSLNHDMLIAYYVRGLDKFCLGDYHGAIDDLHYHFTHNDQSEPHSNYSVIVAALADRKIGSPTKELLDWWKPYQPRSWPGPVLDYLNGKITASDVLAAASDNDKMTEAKTYLGICYELDGKTKEARDYFAWVKDHGNKQFGEYTLAVAELERSDKHSASK